MEHNSTKLAKFVEFNSENSMLSRFYTIDELIQPNKALIIYGARRVGKTTLVSDYLSRTTMKYLSITGENIRYQQVFAELNFDTLLNMVGGYQLFVIDEAQDLPNLGKALKILIDHVEGIHIIVTGSSSFERSHEVGEPLTGRKRTIKLYPFAQLELLQRYNPFELKEKLHEFLIYGSYPEVALEATAEKKKLLLTELADSYLFKDILKLDKVRNPKQLVDIVKLLAFQVGSQVSLTEIATQVKLDVKTVERYLDLLEKVFIIKKVTGFSRNMRNEITGKHKYYFYDNGIRNAVILQFAPLTMRDDVGKLFENFIVSEFMKKNSFTGLDIPLHFWRTYSGQEIDVVYELNGVLNCFELKWSASAKQRIPSEWKKNYPESDVTFVTGESYDWLLFPTKN